MPIRMAHWASYFYALNHLWNKEYNNSICQVADCMTSITFPYANSQMTCETDHINTHDLYIVYFLHDIVTTCNIGVR